jgi:hypothetical protein
MRRRDFTIYSAASALNTVVGVDFAHAQRVKMSGEFDFKLTPKGLKLDAKDVIIDGLTIPKLTWSWIGLAVAQGVLAGLGGIVFGAIANAIFGASGGKSMEQLLQEQLEAIARIVQESLKDEALREYGARVKAYVALFREYQNDPTAATLDFIRNNTAVALAELESLGFMGYRTYMTAAGLRLTILQEVMRSGRTGARKNFDSQREVAIAYHNQIVDLINRETDPAKYAPFPVIPDSSVQQNGWVGPYEINRTILGRHVQGAILTQGNGILSIAATTARKKLIEQRAGDKNASSGIIDWAWLRASLLAENTDLGAKMVNRWTAYKV